MNQAESSNRRLTWESGAEDARTPNADAWSTDSVAREAFGVRPIHRRFPSGAGWSEVHGSPMHGRKAEGSPMNRPF